MIIESLGASFAMALSPFTKATVLDQQPLVQGTSRLDIQVSRDDERRASRRGLSSSQQRADPLGAAVTAAIASSAALLTPANDEPDVWRIKFSRSKFEKVLAAERRAAELVCFLREAAAGVNSDSLPPSISTMMAAFSRRVEVSTTSTSRSLSGWDGSRMVKRGFGVKFRRMCCERRDGGQEQISAGQLDMNFTSALMRGVNAASLVADPLLKLNSFTTRVFLNQRNALMLVMFESEAPVLSQMDAMRWVASTFLCAELARALTDVGDAIRDLRAFQSTPRLRA